MGNGRANLYDLDRTAWGAFAIAEVRARYNHDISLQLDARSNLKFGYNGDVDSNDISTVMGLGAGQDNETYATGNTIDTISSSNAADTQTIVLTTFTLADGAFTRLSQTVTLNGQNKVTLDTPCARVERGRIIPPVTTGLAGTVYVYEDTAISGGVPTDGSKVHLTMPFGNRSFKCALTIPDGEYGIVTKVWGSVLRQANASVDFQTQISVQGGVFETTGQVGAHSQGLTTVNFELGPFSIIPPNTDVRLRADSSANNTAITGQIALLYAKMI